jgi:hypothetical protein
MTAELSSIERRLASPNKRVRLRALKLLFTHPGATPLQLARGLCSADNRNFEFLNVFELDNAMREAWKRLSGVTDAAVYEYLAELYAADPDANVDSVLGVLMHLGTPQALALANQIKPTLPARAQGRFAMVLNTIAARAATK